jgi:hypothetical protein
LGRGRVWEEEEFGKRKSVDGGRVWIEEEGQEARGEVFTR